MLAQCRLRQLCPHDGLLAFLPDARDVLPAQALITCNRCNKRFRWVKFYIDDDNDLIVEADGIIDEMTVGEECIELLFRTVSILDDSYGDFMKAIWA